MNKKKRFVKVVPEHMIALKRFALSLCKNDFDANDLVSETIVKAFENFERLHDENKVKPWLFKILSNQFVSNYRRKKKFSVVNIIKTEDDSDHSGSFSLFEAIAKTDFTTDDNPEKRIISKLTREQIGKAISELQDEFRVSLTLCDIEDFSYAEISQILKIPIGTVRSRIARARTILQKKLWLQARELGIKTVKTPRPKKEYTCTCGKEEMIIPELTNIN